MSGGFQPNSYNDRQMFDDRQLIDDRKMIDDRQAIDPGFSIVSTDTFDSTSCDSAIGISPMIPRHKYETIGSGSGKGETPKTQSLSQTE
jgi:hypothetical protein